MTVKQTFLNIRRDIHSSSINSCNKCDDRVPGGVDFSHLSAFKFIPVYRYPCVTHL